MGGEAWRETQRQEGAACGHKVTRTPRGSTRHRGRADRPAESCEEARFICSMTQSLWTLTSVKTPGYLPVQSMIQLAIPTWTQVLLNSQTRGLPESPWRETEREKQME